MIEDLKQVRDALADCEHEVNCNKIDMQEGGGYYFNNEAKCNCERNKILATLDRIIADHIPDARKMVVPDGYKLVPIEPTKEMIWSGIENTEEFVNGDPWYGSEPLSDGQAEQCYKAMLSSAPTPAQPEKLDVEALKREVCEKYACDIEVETAEVRGIIRMLIDHLASAGYLRAPLPRIDGLEEAIEWQNGKYSYYEYKDKFNYPPQVIISEVARAYMKASGV